MDRAIAIQVSQLTKTYDGHTAVSDLSFQVYAGEIFGLAGAERGGEKHHAPDAHHAADADVGHGQRLGPRYGARGGCRPAD